MNSIKNLERLQQLHALIEKEVTGTPYELAVRLNISERLVYHLIEQLKDYNASIRYNRSRKTYYYDDDFELHVNISVSVISNDEITHIFGGGYSESMISKTTYPNMFDAPIRVI
jgi:transcriptional antiterminator